MVFGEWNTGAIQHGPALTGELLFQVIFGDPWIDEEALYGITLFILYPLWA